MVCLENLPVNCNLFKRRVSAVKDIKNMFQELLIVHLLSKIMGKVWLDLFAS